MKEKQTVPERIIVIDIRLTRGLMVALSCVLIVLALLAYLTLTGDSAAASEPEAAPATSISMRRYYLTKEFHEGPEVLDACAAGYHMASLWEIADPSNLQYNTALGFARGDDGQGPSTEHGWVRTGYYSSVANTAGRANCDAWTSNGSGDYGTAAHLPVDWKNVPGIVGVWRMFTVPCDGGLGVWCIED